MTARKSLLIQIFARDEPGLVSAISGCLFDLGLNLGDTAFAVLGSGADGSAQFVVAVPEGVPGRFSALSAVGLVPAAILGHDIGAVLAGAREARESLSGSLYDCPAYAYGAVAVALERRGAHTNAFVPYAEALEPFAEWFAQLWAESLGKDGQGQTPARAPSRGRLFATRMPSGISSASTSAPMPASTAASVRWLPSRFGFWRASARHSARSC